MYPLFLLPGGTPLPPPPHPSREGAVRSKGASMPLLIPSFSKEYSGRISPRGREALDPSKLMNLILFDSFLVRGTLGNTLISSLPNSHSGKRLVARDMTMFVSHVGPHISYIGYTKEYDGI